MRLGVDALVLAHAVLLSGRSVVEGSRQLGSGKANYWRTAFRLALDEIAALLGRDQPEMPPGVRVLRFASGGDGHDGAKKAHHEHSMRSRPGAPQVG